MKTTMIASCGMNCSLCYAHFREKNKCNGCLHGGESLPDSCLRCTIRNCDTFAYSKKRFCFQCNRFPCRRLKQLDKRYRTKYGMSMIENLRTIKEIGVLAFVKKEKIRWSCSNCGSYICVHKKTCTTCDEPRSDL